MPSSHVWPIQRLLSPDQSTYNAHQQEIHNLIASGPRGQVRGPLAVWLNRPGLAERAQSLGEYCRYDSSLEKRLSELAILTIAKVWKAEFEWFAHEPHALDAGVSESVVNAVKKGDEPAFEKEDEAVVYRFTLAAHQDRSVPDTLYDQALDILGKDRLVDLVGLLGYYSLISLTINIFQISPPPETPPSFS